LSERNDTDNQFNSIAKRRIHQTTDRLAQFHRHLFGRKTKQRCQRHNSEEVEGKDGRRIPIHGAGYDAQRYKYKQDIDIVARESEPCHLCNMFWISDPCALMLVPLDIGVASRLRWQVVQQRPCLAILSARHVI